MSRRRRAWACVRAAVLSVRRCRPCGVRRRLRGVRNRPPNVLARPRQDEPTGRCACRSPIRHAAFVRGDVTTVTRRRSLKSVKAATVSGDVVSGSAAFRPASGCHRASPSSADSHRHLCLHHPPCPPADGPARDAARVTIRHCDQGWSLLCNGVILFDDTGEILPTGGIVEPRRALPRPGCVTPRPLGLPSPRHRTG